MICVATTGQPWSVASEGITSVLQRRGTNEFEMCQLVFTYNAGHEHTYCKACRSGEMMDGMASERGSSKTNISFLPFILIVKNLE